MTFQGVEAWGWGVEEVPLLMPLDFIPSGNFCDNVL